MAATLVALSAGCAVLGDGAVDNLKQSALGRIIDTTTARVAAVEVDTSNADCLIVRNGAVADEQHAYVIDAAAAGVADDDVLLLVDALTSSDVAGDDAILNLQLRFVVNSASHSAIVAGIELRQASADR